MLRCFKGDLRNFQGPSSKFQAGLMGRQGCFLGVSKMFPDCFKSVSRTFKKMSFREVLCCMALILDTRAEGGLVSK